MTAHAADQATVLHQRSAVQIKAVLRTALVVQTQQDRQVLAEFTKQVKARREAQVSGTHSRPIDRLAV